jgi:aminopeptidase N
MEAAANYASLLYLEKQHGPKAMDPLLETFRVHLLRKMEDGRAIEAAGPIVWGLRLHSSLSDDAWRTITYEKGSWIMHMLRRRLGDARFHQLLSETCRRYAHEPITTEQFRKLAESMMGPKAGPEPLAEFFESWIYGTGIPALKLNWSVKGKAPALKLTGTVTQSGVDDDFTIEVPVEVHYAKGAPVTFWVRTSNEPASFSFTVKQAPAKVVLPFGGVLTARH